MSRPICILHLSDLHYNKKNALDISIVTEALIKRLSTLRQTELSPDLVIFSGDLVQDADDDHTYFHLYDEVLERISNACGCPLSRFIFTQGNHDVQRSGIKGHYDKLISLSQRMVSREVINEAFSDGTLNDIIDAKFSAYSAISDYIDYENKRILNPLTSLYKFNELDLQVISINSAMMSWGGYEKRPDLRNLIIPEAAVVDAVRQLDKTKPSFLVTHHPLGWLTEICEADFRSVTNNAFDIHFFGHMHAADPSLQVRLTGTSLENQAGAIYSGRDRYVGFSVTRFDPASKNTAVYLYAFSDQRKEFHHAEQLVEGGVYYPTESMKRFWQQRTPIDRNALSHWVLSTLLPKSEGDLNDGLGDRKLSEVFVPPPLTCRSDFVGTDIEDEDVPKTIEQEILFGDIAKSSDNYIIYGRREYGKTTLLKQFALRAMSLQGTAIPATIPIVISFSDFARGRDKVIRLLRSSMQAEYIGESLDRLLTEGLITILIDDVVFDDKVRFDVLQSFITLYPKNRYILSSSDAETSRFSAVVSPTLPIALQSAFIKPMSRRTMRTLVDKWDHKRKFDREAVLDQLLREIRRINIPATAVNGTILLTIYETQSDFSAINKAVLVENFVEALLDKGSPASIERKKFDFTNQKHLLASVAKWMAKAESYIPQMTDLQDFVREYLRGFGLAQNANTIIETFIQSRILELRIDERIAFRYRSFLEYFLASAMQIDGLFKEWVLEEERYLSYINEIQYYAGINRQDEALLKLIHGRYERIQSEAVSLLNWTPDLKSLNNFSLPGDDASAEEILNDYERQVGAPPLSSEERDEILEGEIPLDVESRQEVYRPSIKDPSHKLILGLILYSGVVRDLELISNGSKEVHLQTVLEGWGVFLMASLLVVPQIARHRKLKINEVLYEVTVPKSFSEAQVARFLYIAMPASITSLIASAVGTEKLELQIKSQLGDGFEAESPIVQYFRHNLLADLKLGTWWKLFETFISRHRASPYMLHIMLWKMRDLHIMGEIPDAYAGAFRRTFAQGIGSLKGGSPEARGKVVSRNVQRLDREDYLRRLRTSRAEPIEPVET